MTSGVIDTAVIGGGLHGLSAALHLARAGQKVVVLERAWSGRHASGASAAGVRTLGRDLREMPLSIQSMRMWHRIEALVGDDCGFHSHGQLRVAATEADLATLTERVGRLQAQGYDNEQMIDQARLRALVPGIAEKFIGAAYAPDDGAADPHKTLRAFRRACAEAGVVLREHAGVTGIRRGTDCWHVTAGGHALVCGRIVNAAGAWGGQIAAMVGDRIPLSAKASMMIVTERLHQTIRPVVSVMGRQLSFKQSSQGTLVIGGGVQGRYDLETEQTTLDFRALASGAAAATELFPSVATVRINRCWSGIEGKTADLVPVIGPAINAPGVVHAFGFSGHGFQLVPAAGAAVAEMVLTNMTPASLKDLGAERLMQNKGEAA
jgi:sarcosine oxidase subunit beta